MPEYLYKPAGFTLKDWVAYLAARQKLQTPQLSWIEHQPSKLNVTGSSPVGVSKFSTQV